MSRVILLGMVDSLRTLKDGSVVIAFGTQELDNDQAARVMGFRNKFVKCLISDSNITAIDERIIEEEKISGSRKAKSPGQRLRAAMYVVHEQQGISVPFQEWYNGEMEKKIEEYKDMMEK